MPKLLPRKNPRLAVARTSQLAVARTSQLSPDWQSPEGDIQLYLGDCLKILPSVFEADMIFTDPPYGHSNNNNDLILRRECALGKRKATTAELQADKTARPIANDGPEANDLFRQILPEFARILAPGCCCCCCGGGGGPDPQFARWSLWLDEVLDFKQMVVWDKGKMGLGWHYRRSYETVLVAQKPGVACRWFDKSGAVENIIRPGKGAKKIIPSAEQHPTQKPIGLASYFIKLHSQEGHLVLDPFMGSGTTGAAAIREGRKFIGIDIDERYFDMAVKRLEVEWRVKNEP